MIVELPGWLENSHTKLFMLRGDLIHPEISGNKWWKLKYNIAHCKEQGHAGLLTFGGAYSNHIAAVAAAGKIHGIRTIGLVRGEQQLALNDTLRKAQDDGMELVYLSREEYRNKDSETFRRHLKKEYPRYFVVPEGGSNQLALRGVIEMMDEIEEEFDMVCVPVGTGGTMAGIISSGRVKSVLGFSALKQTDYLADEVNKLLLERSVSQSKVNWKVNGDFHFGGYAKINRELVMMCETFKENYGFELDYIYTSKMMYGIRELVSSREIPPVNRILAVHTGGIQGNLSMMNRYVSIFNK